MNIYLQILILISSVVIGGFLVDLFKKTTSLKLLLSFSGGFLLTIIFTHILPESYEILSEKTGYFILFGFLLQLVLEYFSRGAEHGHTHVHKREGTRLVFPAVIFLSLSIHAFIESLPVEHSEHEHGGNYLWGIFLHKIPVAVALKTILQSLGYSKFKSWIYLLIFALMAPIGLLSGHWIMEHSSFDLSFIMAIAIGMLLHISTTIIFESSEGHKLNLYKLIAIVLGFIGGVFIL